MCKSLCFWTGQRTGPPSYHESSLSPLQKIKKSGCKSFSIWISSNTSCHLQRKVTQNEWSTLVQCDEAVHLVKTEVLGNVPPETFQLLCRVWWTSRIIWRRCDGERPMLCTLSRNPSRFHRYSGFTESKWCWSHVIGFRSTPWTPPQSYKVTLILWRPETTTPKSPGLDTAHKAHLAACWHAVIPAS